MIIVLPYVCKCSYEVGTEVTYALERKIHAVRPLNSGHLWVLKNLSVIEKCPLLGGSLTKIVTFWTKHFVRYSRNVGY